MSLLLLERRRRLRGFSISSGFGSATTKLVDSEWPGSVRRIPLDSTERSVEQLFEGPDKLLSDRSDEVLSDCSDERLVDRRSDDRLLEDFEDDLIEYFRRWRWYRRFKKL